MSAKRDIDKPENLLCGQADTVFDILTRMACLPVDLHLSIEEIVEGAWEIAYSRPRQTGSAAVVDLASFRALRKPASPQAPSATN